MQKMFWHQMGVDAPSANKSPKKKTG